jgi:hypothetical protein
VRPRTKNWRRRTCGGSARPLLRGRLRSNDDLDASHQGRTAVTPRSATAPRRLRTSFPMNHGRFFP